MKASDIRRARVKKINADRQQLKLAYQRVFPDYQTENSDANRVLSDLLNRFSEVTNFDTPVSDALTMAQELGAFKAVRYIIDMIEDTTDV